MIKLPDKFKFVSNFTNENIVYNAIRVNDYVVIMWNFLGECRDLNMSVEDVIYHFNQENYKFVL